MNDKVREELIMLLLDSEILCNNCGENSPTYCAEAIADYLMAHDVGFVTDNNDGCKWIPVTERLPKETGKYIVCTAKGSVYCTKFYTKRFGTDSNTHITHWMCLPDAPKDGVT